MSTPTRRITPTILDTSFERSLTAKTIRGVYRLVLLVTINGAGCGYVFTFYLPSWLGWGTKLIAYIAITAGAAIWLAVVRMICEYLIVIFAIHEQVAAISHNTRRDDARDPR